MTVASITPTDISRAGTADTLAAANADGYLVLNPNARCWVEVNNGAAAPITVTVSLAGASVDGASTPVKTVSIAAGARKKIGMFPRNLYNNDSERVSVTFSDVASVTFGAWALPLE